MLEGRRQNNCRLKHFSGTERVHGCTATLRSGSHNKETEMLEAIAVVLLVLWLLGLVSSYTLGGFIHVLLVLAIVVILLRVVQGRRAV